MQPAGRALPCMRGLCTDAEAHDVSITPRSCAALTQGLSACLFARGAVQALPAALTERCSLQGVYCSACSFFAQVLQHMMSALAPAAVLPHARLVRCLFACGAVQAQPAALTEGRQKQGVYCSACGVFAQVLQHTGPCSCAPHEACWLSVCMQSSICATRCAHRRTQPAGRLLLSMQPDSQQASRRVNQPQRVAATASSVLCACCVPTWQLAQ